MDTLVKACSRAVGPDVAIPMETGIDALFRKQVEIDGDRLAITYGAQQLSYAQLHRQADALAQRLLQHGVKREEPIGILLDPGIEQIVAQLAIIRAGCSCLPLDPEAPTDRLKFMLQDLGAQIIVSGASRESRVSVPVVLLVDDASPGEAAKPLPLPHRADADQRTHILFTSGTTGTPKAVQILARGIIRLTVNPDYVSLDDSDRIAAIANPTFDASLFEVWGALLNGGTVVVLPKQTYIDPYALRHSLRVQRVTTMFMTVTLFNQTVQALPDAFGSLRQLLIGGEVLNPKTVRTVFTVAPPAQLLNGYGPTECTTFSCCHAITIEDIEAGAIPIGRPIDNTQVYLLDENRDPVPIGQLGEIYIGGDGVAREYWNRPDLNAARFVDVPGLVEGGSARLYRSGDIGRMRPDGVLEYHGRNDNQVKIRGHRIEIEEIEAVLLAAEPVLDAAVSVHRTELGNGYLIAHVVLDDTLSGADGMSRQAIEAMLGLHLEARLPVHMRPRLAVVPELPMNANGKVDRRALAKLHPVREVSPDHDTAPAPTSDSSTLSALKSMWQTTLDLPAVDRDDDFFALGGDSLAAAGLILQIGDRFALNVPVQALYEHRTPAALAGYVESRLQHGGGLKANDEVSVWLADAMLPDDIQPLPGPVPHWRASNAGRVLLTGASGFLGAFVLRDLLRLPDVTRVVCLVRASDHDDALLRIRRNLAAYGLWDDTMAGRIEALAGNLDQPDLGLSDTGCAALARRIDAVFHLAARVNYAEPYSLHKAANVAGTVHLLKFVTCGTPKSLHYLSTIAVFGPAGLLQAKEAVLEDEDMRAYLPGLKFDLGYSQSKWVGEQLVLQAIKRGVPASIYRPGFILGDSRTGVGNQNDFVARLVKGCIAVGSYPVLQRQSKEMVPVDFVSRALLHIADNAANLGRAYHLVPTRGNKRVDLAAFFDMLRHCGLEMTPRPYSAWVRTLRQHPRVADNPLLPLLPMLTEPVYGPLTRWEVYEGMPVYDATNTEKALADTSDPALPAMNEDMLHAYLRHWAV